MPLVLASRGGLAGLSIMRPVLADMHHRLALAEQRAADDTADEQVVVAGVEAAGGAALQVRQRLAQHRRAAAGPLHLQPRERRLAQREAAAEVADHVGLAVV